MTTTELTEDPTAVDATPTALDAEPVEAASTEGADLVEEELLVEEVSIDGMCGVY